MIETEVGNEDYEEMLVYYEFGSETPNSVIAFVGDKYPEVSLDARWVKSLIYQEDLNALGDALLERFITSLFHVP